MGVEPSDGALATLPVPIIDAANASARTEKMFDMASAPCTCFNLLAELTFDYAYGRQAGAVMLTRNPSQSFVALVE